MKNIKKTVINILFCAALFFTGAGVGLCVNVFMARGVPVVNGGGELLLLFALPASVGVGFKLGADYVTRRRRRDNAKTAQHTD